jgi:hypothetical protein
MRLCFRSRKGSAFAPSHPTIGTRQDEGYDTSTVIVAVRLLEGLHNDSEAWRIGHE